MLNSFGLGLVLDFTDNASGSMQSVMNTFNQLNGLADNTVEYANRLEFSVMALESAGQGFNVVGSQLMSFGTRLTGVFTGLVSSVTDVGSQLMSARSQLGTLYGSIEAGEEVIEKAKSYAATSIFNFEDLLPSIIMLKANGIEAFDEISSSTGNARQTLMDYAADLAAFNPQMRNAYGTGIQAAMGALNEYIAEGNAMSLKRGTSLDITQLLGEDKGATIEERSRQVADLLEKLNMVGAVSNMAGTASQRLSNVEDIFFNLKSMVSDAGVFDAYTQTVQALTNSLLEEFTVLEDGTVIQNEFFISTEMWENFAKILSEAIMAIIEPITQLAAKLSELLFHFVNFVNEHPKLAKMMITIGAIAGVALVGAGAVLKLSGSFFQLLGSLYQTSKLFKEGISAGHMFKNSFLALNTAILPLIATAILLYEVWDKNIFGIRDILVQAFEEIGNIVSLTFDAFTDNTLSYEQFEKAKDLGILPFIEAILQLKYHVGMLISGFKTGFGEFFTIISNIMPKVELVKGAFYDVANTVGEFIGKITGVETDGTWEAVGNAIGKVAGALTVALPIIKAVKLAIGLFSGPLGIITTILSVLGIAWKNNVGGIQEKLQPVIDWFKNIDWGAIWSKITAAMQPVIDWFMSIDWGAIWDATLGTLKQVWEWLEPLVTEIGNLFKSLFDSVFKTDFGSPVSKMLGFAEDNGGVNNVIGDTEGLNAALEKPVTLFSAIADAIKTIGNVVKDVMPLVTTAFTIVKDVLGKVFSVLSEYIIPVVAKVVTKIISLITSLVEKIRPLIQRIVDWVTAAWNGWLGDLVMNIIEFVALVIDTIAEIVAWLVDVLGPVIEIVVDAISNAIGTVLDIVMPVVDIIGTVINTIMGVINGLINFILGIFTGDWERAWDGVCSIFSSIFEGIVGIGKGIINALIGVVNGIIRGLNMIKVPDWVPGIGGFGINIPEIPKLNTGGEIKGEGVSYLHPNEVVVNSETTNGLRDFLSDYKKGETGTSEELISHLVDSSFSFLNSLQNIAYNAASAVVSAINPSDNAVNILTTNNTSSIDNSIGSITNNTVSTNRPTEVEHTIEKGDTFNVNFAAGSITIQANGVSDTDLDDIAERLMKIIKRKTDLRGMAVRAR